MLKDFCDEFERYRTIGQRALDQVSDDDLNRVLGQGNNSIAVIVRHIGGNLISRFTEFLSSDGEKPWRDRDAEFEQRGYGRSEMLDWWDRGWGVLNTALASLKDADMGRSITIRGQAFTVSEALARSVTHVAYHVGQIVVLSRIMKGDDWQWITVPRGKSKEYNSNPTMEKGPK